MTASAAAIGAIRDPLWFADVDFGQANSIR
jgi:hypothetical protein